MLNTGLEKNQARKTRLSTREATSKSSSETPIPIPSTGSHQGPLSRRVLASSPFSTFCGLLLCCRAQCLRRACSEDKGKEQRTRNNALCTLTIKSQCHVKMQEACWCRAACCLGSTSPRYSTCQPTRAQLASVFV